MAELRDITRALEQVDDFTMVQRILLTCAGTLQGTLSAVFRTEVTVEVLEQSTTGESGGIKRSVALKAGSTVVCAAESTLYLDREDIRQAVMDKQMGIGQILEELDVRVRFRLLSVGRDMGHFWREYELKGLGVKYWISERFPRALYCRKDDDS